MIITHPEKIMFPAEGITKGELASYYETIAPVMLPHLRGRAVFVGRIGKRRGWTREFDFAHDGPANCGGR